MTKEEYQLVNALRKLAEQVGPMQTFIGLVKSVNTNAGDTEEGYTCAVTLNDETEIPAARLRAVVNGSNPVVMIPKVNTYVLLARIENSSEWIIIAVDQVDEVIWKIKSGSFTTVDGFVFDAGSNKGMVKVLALKTKLNNLENKVNEMITKFNTHVHAGVTTGGGSSAITPTPVAGTLTPTTQADIENTKVKH